MRGPKARRWPDDVVARCLRAQDPDQLRTICAETPGLSYNVAHAWRGRFNKRAVVLAHKLGLPPLLHRPTVERPYGETSLDIFRRAVRR